MHKVSNHKCISNISRKSMKANRKRNLILVVAIALTSLMLTAIFTLAGSMIVNMEKATMYQVGSDLHAGFKFLTQEQYNTLLKDNKINGLCYNIIVGQSNNEELREDYTEIRYTDKLNAQHSFAMPQNGRLPKNDNEIATCTDVLDDFGLSYELGQKIHLEIFNGIDSYEGDFVVCGIWEKPAATLVNQIFVSKGFQERFSPVWQNNDDRKKFEKANSYAGSINPGFNFPNRFNLDGQMSELKARHNFGSEVNDGVNWAYSTASVDMTGSAIMVFLLLIIMVSGYLIISTIFNISVTADIHYYGLLKTIGTTNRQLKKIVIRQAIFVSIVAIPIGLVSGYLVSMVIFPIIVSHMINIPNTMVFNVWFFVVSAIFSWITVRISCVRPCRIVRKISPVEAVKYTDIPLSVKKVHRKARRVTPVTMAWQNINRNKRRTITVVFSMALSVIMLNLSVSVVASFDENLYVKSFANSDYTVADATVFNKWIARADYEGVNQTDIEYCKKMNGIEELGAIYMSTGVHKIDGSVLEEVKKFYNKIKDEINADEAKAFKSGIFDKHEINSNVYGVDKMIYDSLEMDTGKIEWEKFKTGRYAVISAPIEGTDNDADTSFYKIGDNIQVELSDGTEKSYEVMGIGDVPYAMGPGYSYPIGINITIPSEEYLLHSQSKGAMKLCFNVDDIHNDDVEADLIKYCDEKNPLLDFESRNKYKENFREMQWIFLLIGGAMSLILALIGILNFVNLTYSSINERRNELSMLHAIGMTFSQIRDMLVAEGVIRILFTFAAVFTIGIGLNHTIVSMIAGQMIMFKYRFTVWPMMSCIPLYLLIAVIVPQKIRWRNKE